MARAGTERVLPNTTLRRATGRTCTDSGNEWGGTGGVCWKGAVNGVGSQRRGPLDTSNAGSPFPG
jgi:hypothetical protein